MNPILMANVKGIQTHCIEQRHIKEAEAKKTFKIKDGATASRIVRHLFKNGSLLGVDIKANLKLERPVGQYLNKLVRKKMVQVTKNGAVRTCRYSIAPNLTLKDFGLEKEERND